MKPIHKLLILLLAAGMLFMFTACDPYETYDISRTNTGTGVSSARVFYPSNIGSLNNVGSTTLSSGMGGSKEGMYWLAGPLAEAGLIVLAISASDNMMISGYERAHRRGLEILNNENSRSGSPIRGKVGSRGLIGYSKGGGAVLNVASALGTQVGTCVALAPYSPSVRSGHRAATMILTSSRDSIAPPRMGEGAYRDIPRGVPKLYASMRGESHMYWNNLRSTGSETEFIKAWLKYYLEDDQASYNVFSRGAGSGMTDYRFDPGTGSPPDDGGCN